jgi:16S rRNA (guanine527-N7)-methyltransferase
VNATNQTLWTQLAERAGLQFDETQLNLFSRYLDFLLEANAKMNLTRITDRASAEILHIADSLTLLPFLPGGAHRLADVGSGGGVPGIVLAIARPDAAITLIESTKKKADFLHAACQELKLNHVIVDPRRAEEAGQSHLREAFDITVGRAVGTLDWLVEWMLPLTKVGGQMMAMKGPKAPDELAAAKKAIRTLGGGEATIEASPDAGKLSGAENHVIVKIPKMTKTNPRYPRSASDAKGRPLG